MVIRPETVTRQPLPRSCTRTCMSLFPACRDFSRNKTNSSNKRIACERTLFAGCGICITRASPTAHLTQPKRQITLGCSCQKVRQSPRTQQPVTLGKFASPTK